MYFSWYHGSIHFALQLPHGKTPPLVFVVNSIGISFYVQLALLFVATQTVKTSAAFVESIAWSYDAPCLCTYTDMYTYDCVHEGFIVFTCSCYVGPNSGIQCSLSRLIACRNCLTTMLEYIRHTHTPNSVVVVITMVFCLWTIVQIDMSHLDARYWIAPKIHWNLSLWTVPILLKVTMVVPTNHVLWYHAQYHGGAYRASY